MSSINGPFANRVSKMAEAIPARRNLSVAVLGPSVGDGNETPGGRKRKQIRNALTDDGHQAFFPEEHATSNPLGPSLLAQERNLLDNPDVDLVIILHTDRSIGTLQETAYFIDYPSIVAKTGVLYPSKFYRAGANMFSDTVSNYLVRMPYSDRQFQACELVSECRNWADMMARGYWVGFEPHRF